MTPVPSVKDENVRLESVPAAMQEDDYRRMLRQFDLLWESSTTEHDQQEMQRLLALIESYEHERKIRALPSPSTTLTEQARHQLQHPGSSLKGEPP